MMRRTWLAAALAATIAMPAAAAPDAAPATVTARLPQDEVIYFLLPDRFANGDPSNDKGGLTGGRLVTGFDPADKAFYHGGDLKGLTEKLPYIQALGATAIWVGPIFKNKPVQGPPGHESAGYHGYWITDFTRVDPHFGTNADFKTLVDAAHARGMKVYMDIVVNHTADVIQYRDCPESGCAYRSIADYPYQRQGGVHGKPINPGFAGDQVMTADNFAKLTDPNYAYQVVIPKAEAHEKVPDWLNDPIYYHNRGNSTFKGESSTMGDFAGLDDLMTENPRVVQGFIDIFGKWIDDFRIDGFRIDTEQHVNSAFWRRFVPAMLARAKADGIPHFHIFGEVATGDMDPAHLAEHTRTDGIPAVLDFAFARAVNDVVEGKAGTEELARLFAADPLYAGGADAAMTLPTFLGNHDFGRVGMFLRTALPKASPDEILKRDLLAHAMLLTLRGVPTIYSGDEQGFAGAGGDQDARQDMFASKVASYNADSLIGSNATTAIDNFDEDQPLFREIAMLAKLRTSHPALTRGRQIVRYAGDAPGLFAVSRFDPDTGAEYLIAFNTAATPLDANVLIETGSTAFDTLAGNGCAATATAPGSLHLSLAPFGYAVCAAKAH
ncbi:alpha-amylase family glycosyl hydrolase [Hephaestia mangrovi]|uniref:alpha-amylase family glycosyl hydrolase n=1 Tax=Hephaestia mangrovi TaxID=2873268 RepID=UPI001CA5F8A2|nr:alpha-amylase family glycosyl hydrolase [Hephaestia mangrovi]MBY8828567.1 alpha-amylase [Hephaestia mangrovi]